MEEEKKKTTRKTTRTPRVTKPLTKEKEPKKTVRKRTVKKEETKEEIQIVKKSADFSLVEVIVIILITGIVVSIASGLIDKNNYY